MNWRKLKEFCNSLPESELDKNVILWLEDLAINNIEAEVLDEDHYISADGSENWCLPESDAVLLLDYEDIYPNGIDDLKKAYDKGTPILYENF